MSWLDDVIVCMSTRLSPIVEYIQTILYTLSRELAELVQPLLGKTSPQIQHSQDVVKEMPKWTNGPRWSIGVIVRINRLWWGMRYHTNLHTKPQGNASIYMISWTCPSLYLVQHTLDLEVSSINNNMEWQCCSLVSPIVVALFMEDLEINIISKTCVEYRPDFGKYVDDTICAVKKGEEHHFRITWKGQIGQGIYSLLRKINMTTATTKVNRKESQILEDNWNRVPKGW